VTRIGELRNAYRIPVPSKASWETYAGGMMGEGALVQAKGQRWTVVADVRFSRKTFVHRFTYMDTLQGR